jgi:hypothetical protein
MILWRHASSGCAKVPAQHGWIVVVEAMIEPSERHFAGEG